ncbi:MAG: ribosome maturation factor RimP [Rhodococcus sp.]|nr:ribosome maturation factor RimP [Rhodococcus sp. (in: high G+C Gram-positive bacteria)]
MSIPSRERISELVSDLVERQGFDLEDVVVTSAGSHSVVRIMIDSDRGVGLDAAADLSREIGELFDSSASFGEAPYTLEVTSPGIDRPLTEQRHWRRAQGRLAKVELADETIDARIGPLSGDDIALVVGGKRAPSVRTVPLSEIRRALVQVEFSRPSSREVELAGGVLDGRVSPLDADTDLDALADESATQLPSAESDDTIEDTTKGQDK